MLLLHSLQQLQLPLWGKNSTYNPIYYIFFCKKKKSIGRIKNSWFLKKLAQKTNLHYRNGENLFYHNTNITFA